MKYRIAIWTTVGLLVAAGWAVYFANSNKDYPMDPILYALACVTQPIVLFVRHSPLSLGLVLVANAITYALCGVIVETLRRPARLRA